MFRHVRIVVLLALVGAVMVGLMLPGPKKEERTARVSQVTSLAIN
jgi:hypothetical protein